MNICEANGISIIQKKCGEDCVQMSTRAVKQVVKDVYRNIIE